MPGSFTDGLEKQDGDPQTRCWYNSADRVKVFRSVKIFRWDFSLNPDEPGQPDATDVRSTVIDGRPGWSWREPSGSAWAAFDSGDEAAALVITDESLSDKQLRAKVLALAAAVSKSLRSDGPMSGAVTAPPTTSYEKVPAGTRAWPHVVCDVMPAKLLEEMEGARGHDDERCRLSSDTGDARLEYEVRREVHTSVRPDDMGPTMHKESFDGRTAYSYVSDNVSSPTAYVEFDTAGKEKVVVQVVESDISTNIDKEKVRKDAVALAAQIAPRLPKP
ncbi:MAG: hypothetical protein L0H26_12930 [Microlunatus sp.]|nr:hypothetical protein [Microlunatus sp.]